MNEFLEVFLRGLVAVIYLFLLTKAMGVKHISQLTLFDYTIGITIGNVAGTMSVDTEINILIPLIVIALLALSNIVISYITRKSIIGRRVITGNPCLLIEKGQFVYKNLKRSQFDINDLLVELRQSGYFNVADVQYAILETNGKISIQPKELKRPVVAEDINAQSSEQSLYANVIIDGKALKGNLNTLQKDENWLVEQIKSQGFSDIKDILLGTLDEDGKLSLYAKIEDDNTKRTVFQ